MNVLSVFTLIIFTITQSNSVNIDGENQFFLC